MTSSIIVLSTLCLLCACATSRPDHFHILSSRPQDAGTARTAAVTQAALSISLPSLVDRSEMVLDTGPDEVTVLEHERWAAPLTDLMAQTLAQDIERRRADLLVVRRDLAPGTGAAVKVWISVVQMTVRRGDKASLETQWRIFDGRHDKEEFSGATISAPVKGNDYDGVAQAVSECLALLADRLVAQIPLE